MTTDNTERGGGMAWIEVPLSDGWVYRYRFFAGALVVERRHEWWREDVAWDSIHSVTNEWRLVEAIANERTAARDRERALAELVATWRVLRGQYNDVTCGMCADELEALLTNPTAHVEADRQGEVMRQMYEALKVIGLSVDDELSDEEWDSEQHQAAVDKVRDAIAAYEALRGTEGVKHGA